MKTGKLPFGETDPTYIGNKLRQLNLISDMWADELKKEFRLARLEP